MKNLIVPLLTCSLLLTPLITVADIERANGEEEIAHQDRMFRARYADGTQERYLVAYRGIVKQYARESGGPAIPEQGKFIDNRQCHWNIDSRIERTVYLVHRSGRNIPYEKLSNRWQVPFTNKGSDFVLTQLRSENCNDAWARFASDVTNAKQRVNAEFVTVIASDLETLKKSLANELNGEVVAERER